MSGKATAKAAGRKSIFITGAASGIGRATATLVREQRLVRRRLRLNEQGLATLTQEIGGGNCITGRLDVTAKQDFEAAVAAFGAETDGHMDVLFNNAGIGESGWFEDIPYEAALRVVQVNFVGVLTGIYTALPLLKATKNSLCFTTSSSSATYGMPRLAVYSATKHAVKGLTEALSIEFARHGIRAADTLPGLIDTAILRNTPNRTDGRTPDEAETLLANAPKKGPFRLMPPGAVAEAVWAAYASDKLHWYVPPEIAWIDRIKGLSPETIRKRIKKMTGGLLRSE